MKPSSLEKQWGEDLVTRKVFECSDFQWPQSIINDILGQRMIFKCSVCGSEITRQTKMRFKKVTCYECKVARKRAYNRTK